MASLNLSSDGPAINRSYKSLVDAPVPTGAAASSPTYGQWAVYSVTAPLLSAFQQDSSKESTLRVQSTGEGELVDLIDEFSDGRIQFAFVRIKDPNTTLPKSVLIAWCGEGVPERTKGYFTSHLAAVSKLLHGYHVQVTARTENDLSPDSIIRKVADASGSKYSGDTGPASETNAPPAPVASKPKAFTPTQGGSGSKGFNPLGSRSRTSVSKDVDTDEDGWGADAPRVTRTQLEKVSSAYKPTKVNMAELTSQKTEPSRFQPKEKESTNDTSDVIRSGYQPIGKVDIAAIRRQAQHGGNSGDDRPAPVKGSYEPVGKVDIAAIRARAQPSVDNGSSSPSSAPLSLSRTGGSAGGDDDQPKSLADRSAAFKQSERISALPKPKVANRFGSTTSSFTGTKAPAPIGYQSKVNPASAPIGLANKNFAEEGGKTPAQLWAERKARERGNSGAGETAAPSSTRPPLASQTSGSGQWESGYGGKKWAAVPTNRTGQSANSEVPEERADDSQTQEKPASPVGNVSAIRDRFKNTAPIGSSRPSPAISSGFEDERAGEEEEDEDRPTQPPRTNMATKPNAGPPGRVALPGLARPAAPADEDEDEDEPTRLPTPPPQPPRSPSPPTPPAARSASPIRIIMPVSRTKVAEIEPPEERFSPPPMPTASMGRAVPPPREIEDEPQVEEHDPARSAGMTIAATTFGATAVSHSGPGAGSGGKQAIVQFDYEKAEDNELELKEGERVTNIEMVDDDWWMGENAKGEKGLFPSNYVELIEDDGDEEQAVASPSRGAAAPSAPPTTTASAKGPTATAEFDYEAAEENELSFPEGAKITSLEFPDDDWWLGEYNGNKGLFPANYVKLDK